MPCLRHGGIHLLSVLRDAYLIVLEMTATTFGTRRQDPFLSRLVKLFLAFLACES